MAQDPISYSRFTQLPSNISVHGSTLEEIKSARGKPDRNVALSPMAAPRRSATRLFLRPSGSDQLRMGQPAEPAGDPSETAPLALSRFRSVLVKLGGGVLADLQATVEQGAVSSPQVQQLIMDSLRRVEGLTGYLKNQYALTQGIVARQVGSRS